MACKVCCEDSACCIHSATPAAPGSNYPIIGSVGVPAVGQCVSVPRGPCAHGFRVPGSPLVFRGTPKNIGCNRANCNDTPCYCCCQGQCFEIACTEAASEACASGGGAVVANCDSCGSYDGDLYGACCSQECDGFHCRRMTACECAQNAQSSGRRFSYFAGPGTECEEVARCCVDGTADPEITGESECISAGGSWIVGHACDQYPCGSPPCNCFCDEENPCPEGCVCVDGQCVPTIGSCCGWSCDYVAELVWPEIENPEDVPDVSDAMIAAGWVLVGIEWRKTIVGEANCDDPEAANAKEQELKAEVDGIIGGQGGFSNVNIDPMASGSWCLDNTGQQECDDAGGTFRPGISCEDEPTCEENPLP